MVPTNNCDSPETEPHSQLLQSNIEKLHATLRHWQLWEAEYEGLKEEILAIDSKSGPKDLITLCEQYDGDLVTKKEVNEILKTTTSCDTAQVINLLDRRIDYVERNVCTVQRQIEAAKKMSSAVSIPSTSEIPYEEGLPLTEIMEELDDQGNVVSSRLITPGSSKPQLLELLRNAGVKDLPMHTETDTQSALVPNTPKDSSHSKATKKNVSFVDGTKLGPGSEKKSPKGRRQMINKPQQNEISSFENPIIPSGESPEDAALRREMIEYGISEVGSVVAELEIESNSDWSSDWSEQDSEDSEEAEYSSNEEDAFGRSTGRIISDKLRKRMIELEERMGQKVMKEISNSASDLEIVEEGIGQISIQKEENNTEKPKKVVKFPENNEVSSSQDAPPTSNSRIVNLRESRISQMSENSERSKTSKASNLTSYEKMPPAQGSASNQNELGTNYSDRPVRRISKGQPLATTITERETPISESVIEPDNMNPHLLRQEIAVEYYRMRNLMIQRQGGFMKESESERVEFTEEEGGPKKMSRFKAARLAKS